MSRSQLTALLTFVILLVLGAGAYFVLAGNVSSKPNVEDTATETNSSTTPTNNESAGEDEALDAQPATDFIETNIPETLVGEHEGSALLLNAGLEFPEATFAATEGLRFQLEASGFDLALLADESLAIEENTYPRLRFVMGGTVSEVATKDFVLSLSDFTPEFYVLDLDGEEAVLSAEVQQNLLAKLEAVGVTLPVVSPANPNQFPVTIMQTVTGGFILEAAPESDQIFFYESTGKDNE